MPGSLILESMSQVATFLVLSNQAGACSQGEVLFAGAKALRFLTPVYPGTDLIIYSNLEKQRMGIYTFASRCEIDHQICATAELTLRKVGDR